MASFRILHLSDLHARALDGPQAARAKREAARRVKVLGRAWQDNLRELQDEGKAFDLLAFTGDLADWGHATDYAMGVALLRETCDALRIPRDRLFIVPGNHDVDRGKWSDIWLKLRDLASERPDDFSRWIVGGHAPFGADDGWRDQILERTATFWSVVGHDLDRAALLPRSSPHGRLGYRATLELAGRQVHIIGLDSAWMAGDDKDAGRLWITEDQANLLTTDEHGHPLAGFRLGLVHHPLTDVASGDKAPTTIYDNIDLLLRGHQHTAASTTTVGPDRKLHELAAGCLYEGDGGNRYPNGFHVIDVNFDDAAGPPTIDVRFRGWSEHWFDDASLFRAAERGRLSFRLTRNIEPVGLRAASAVPTPAVSGRAEDGAPPVRRLRRITLPEQERGAASDITPTPADNAARPRLLIVGGGLVAIATGAAAVFLLTLKPPPSPVPPVSWPFDAQETTVDSTSGLGCADAIVGEHGTNPFVEATPHVWIQRFEVSTAEFSRYRRCQPTPSVADSKQPDGGEERQSMTNVDLAEAAAFCNWLHAELPSERDWKAALAGTRERVEDGAYELNAPPDRRACDTICNLVDGVSEWLDDGLGVRVIGPYWRQSRMEAGRWRTKAAAQLRGTRTDWIGFRCKRGDAK